MFVRFCNDALKTQDDVDETSLCTEIVSRDVWNVFIDFKDTLRNVRILKTKVIHLVLDILLRPLGAVENCD